MIVKNGKIKIEKIGIPLSEIIVDQYKYSVSFHRYHLRHKGGKIAVFSLETDDFLQYFQENHPEQVQSIAMKSHKHDGPYVSVLAEEQNLFYNLDSGEYTLTPLKGEKISYIPEVYTYDPEYKLGKALFKRKK